MYREERIINGILHWRGTPDGEFVAYTAEELAEKLEKAELLGISSDCECVMWEHSCIDDLKYHLLTGHHRECGKR